MLDISYTPTSTFAKFHTLDPVPFMFMLEPLAYNCDPSTYRLYPPVQGHNMNELYGLDTLLVIPFLSTPRNALPWETTNCGRQPDAGGAGGAYTFLSAIAGGLG